MSSYHNVRSWRMSVYQDTKKNANKYAVTPSIKIKYNALLKFEPKYEATPIVITNEDSLHAGMRVTTAGANPLLLNFACERNPGGGVETGAGAQEESLFRRTNLCLTLRPDMYPILDHEGIYTPAATVFRDSEDANCDYLKTPWCGAFSTVPGLRRPQLENGRLKPYDVSRLQKKIHIICQMGAQHGHDVLVLGALGCGAWMNPPAHVAEIFRDTLKVYNGVFKEIVFAIYDRAGSENYAAFKQVFSA